MIAESKAIYLVKAEKGRGNHKQQIRYAFESREDAVNFLESLTASKWKWSAHVIEFIAAGQAVEGFPVQGRLLGGGE